MCCGRWHSGVFIHNGSKPKNFSALKRKKAAANAGLTIARYEPRQAEKEGETGELSSFLIVVSMRVSAGDMSRVLTWQTEQLA